MTRAETASRRAQWRAKERHHRVAETAYSGMQGNDTSGGVGAGQLHAITQTGTILNHRV